MKEDDSVRLVYDFHDDRIAHSMLLALEPLKMVGVTTEQDDTVLVIIGPENFLEEIQDIICAAAGRIGAEYNTIIDDDDEQIPGYFWGPIPEG